MWNYGWAIPVEEVGKNEENNAEAFFIFSSRRNHMKRKIFLSNKIISRLRNNNFIAMVSLC